ARVGAMPGDLVELAVSDRGGPGPGGVLPFRLGGQAIAVGGPVADDAVRAGGVALAQAPLAREGVAEGDGVLPRDGLDRLSRAGRGARRMPGDGVIEVLGHRIAREQEGR